MTLITRDTKGKIRVLTFVLNYIKDDDGEYYTITRFSGLYNGKITSQPSIKIDKGKVKRTLSEQAKLQFDSLVNKAIDKGYRNITDFGYNTLEEFNPNDVFPKDKVSVGTLKPMLCKVYDKNDKKTQAIKEWYCSYKHDGVRCLVHCGSNGCIKTISRGGKNYDVPATYALMDTIPIFRKYPNIVLDGELYIHGKPLSYISGLCRLETLDEKHKDLKFHCYDIVDESLPFKERYKILQEIKTLLPKDSKVVIVDHYIVHNHEEIMEIHDRAISEGYEGAVIRDPDQVYKCEARDRRMQKIKIFSDKEFIIKDLVEGLRDEDLCFLMETEEGYEFKAKPIGDRQLKQWYRDHINEIKGKLGVVKYFGMTTTEHPVPNLPVFKCVRDEKDI